MTEKFTVTGMSCSACSSAVSRAVKSIEGVRKADVNLVGKTLVCEYDEKKVTPKQIINTVNKIGFKAFPYSVSNENTENNLKSIKRRLISSVCLLLVLMYISMGSMFGLYLPKSILLNQFLFTAVQIIITLPILIINRKFFINGFKSACRKSPNMDTLVALGSSASFLYGIYVFFNLNTSPNLVHNLYFESSAMILTLISVGKYLEECSKNKTGNAIKKLMNLTPSKVTLLKNGKEIYVDADEILPGDILVLKAGDILPIDGIVEYGNAELDQSAITGESMPVYKSTGDNVISATKCIDGFIHVKATKTGADTTLSQIIELVKNANTSKAPIERIADKVSGVFVPVVICIAVITFIMWLILGYNIDFALTLGISVLVISCPCALGLATPMAIMVSTGKCASYGILVKSAKTLEILHNTDTVVMDKTGTLTNGTPKVNEIFPQNKENVQYLASLEALSNHPLSKAVTQYASGYSLLPVNDFKTVIGKGICGKINNTLYYAGNKAYMNDISADTSFFDDKSNDYASRGNTIIYFAKDRKVLCIVALSDNLKETSRNAVLQMKKMHLDTVMLTGDNAKTAKIIGDKIGINNIIPEVLPNEKENVILSLQSQAKKVVMIGDGINDSPALSRADVGIAVKSGSDIAIDSADIILMKNDLNDVTRAIKISKATIKNIKQNLFWAFFYNALGIPIAAGILYPAFNITLNPMIAAAAMSLSSLFVATNALRLNKIL